MKKILFILFVVSISNVTLFAQSSGYDIYIENAKKQFVEGNYESAGRNLAAYQNLTDKEDPVLKSKIDKCLNLLEEADSLSKINKKEDAIKCYYKVLDINPNDEIVFTKIAELKNSNTEKKLSLLYNVGDDIYQDGKRLKDSEIRMLFIGSQAYELYESASKVDMSAVNGCLYGFGVPLFIAGAIMQIGWEPSMLGSGWNNDNGSDLAYAGLGLMGASVIMMIIPPIVKASINTKIKKAVNIYNYETQKKQKVDLSVNLLPNGIGMKCVF